MKKLISILCVASSISAANGSATVKPNKDKPFQLILASASGSGLMPQKPYESCGTAPIKTKWDYHHAAAGSYSQTQLLEGGPPCSIGTGFEVYETWDADLVEIYEYWKTWYYDFPEVYREREVIQTNNTSLWFPWSIGSLSEYHKDFGTLKLSSQASLRLRTGGKKGSRLKQLFRFEASAIAYFGLRPEALPQPEDGEQRSLRIAGTAAPASWDTGTLYGVFPDQATIDITPEVNAGFYDFIVYASKYRSHFSVGVDMPFPNGTNAPPAPNLSDYGHVWWRFSTEAPIQAIEMFLPEEHLEQSFIGASVGYYPVGIVYWTFGLAASGILDPQEPNGKVSAPDASKVYEIGFMDLVNGVRYTADLYQSPGWWVAPTHNCVHEARNAGAAAGVSVPGGTFPQYLGEIYRDNPQ